MVTATCSLHHLLAAFVTHLLAEIGALKVTPVVVRVKAFEVTDLRRVIVLRKVIVLQIVIDHHIVVKVIEAKEVLRAGRGDQVLVRHRTVLPVEAVVITQIETRQGGVIVLMMSIMTTSSCLHRFLSVCD